MHRQSVPLDMQQQDDLDVEIDLALNQSLDIDRMGNNGTRPFTCQFDIKFMAVWLQKCHIKISGLSLKSSDLLIKMVFTDVKPLMQIQINIKVTLNLSYK